MKKQGCANISASVYDCELQIGFDCPGKDDCNFALFNPGDNDCFFLDHGVGCSNKNSQFVALNKLNRAVNKSISNIDEEAEANG